MKLGNAARCWEFLGVSEDRFNWMTPIITPTPKSLLNVGCQDGKEALALSFLFSPREILVCDMDTEGKLRLEQELSELNSRNKSCWAERPTIDFVQWDLTTGVPFSAQKTFDCVYCDNVLYNIYADKGEDELSDVISKLSQLTSQGGFIVLVEPKIGKNPTPRQQKGASSQTDDELSWMQEFLPRIVLTGETLDITPIMEKKGFSIIHHDAKRARYVGRKN